MSWLRRLRNRWREDDLARDFDAELHFHLDARTEANLRRGMTPEDAAREARRHLGNLTRAREEMRAARVATWFDGLGADVRHGIRVFAHHPLLTCLAVLTLSLGIGANAAIFSVFEAVLLRPLPYSGAERLVVLLDGRLEDRTVTTPTIPELLDVRGSVRSFDALTFFDTRDFQIAGGEEPQRAVGARIEASFFSTLGVRPALGRLFDDVDSRNGNAAIVVLGSGLWRRNFGADPAVVGRTLLINGEPCRIIGVLPDSFSFAFLSSASIDLFLPYPTSSDYMSRSGQFANVRRVSAIARLAPGVALEGASAELATASHAIATAHPELYPVHGGADPGYVMTARPLRELLTRNSRPVLLLLIGAVAVLLLVASVNTAQFLLAQALEREPELALRTALGAGRGRLIRQFVTEALLLASAGGLLGLANALWLIRVLTPLVPRATPVIGTIGLDAPVLAFLLLVTIATAIASVLAPALRTPRGSLAGRLGTRSTDADRGRLRQVLIATEVALSVVLLVCAGLLLRSLFELQRAQGGFVVDGVTVLRMRGMSGGGPSTGDLYQRYLAQVAGIAGIEAAGVSSSVLPTRPGVSFTIVGDANAPARAAAQQQASYQIVSGGYFGVLGIPLEAGRLFTDDDTSARPPVAIVNREMARRFWADGSPIGRQIRAGEGPRAATMTIVGVVGNVRPPFQVGEVPQIYVSYRQQSEPNIVLTVRTLSRTSAPIAAIKRAIWSVEPRQAVFDVDSLESQLALATNSQRALARLLAGFAALALAMSISGVYTVITYLVCRRFREIAIRRAIGATGRDVMWSLARPTLGWTLAGLIAGAAGAIAGSRGLRAAVTGVVPLNLSLTTAVAAAYLFVVVLAIAAAARGALRIDPAVALRAE
jgi:putative ABC transport system permease protein